MNQTSFSRGVEASLRIATSRIHTSVLGAFLGLGLLSSVSSAALLEPPELVWDLINLFAIDVGDVNNDGRPDIVFTALAQGSQGVHVLLQRSDGSFETPLVLDNGFLPSVVVGDFNNDGLGDIGRPIGGGIALFLQTPDGTFEDTGILGSQATGIMIKVGDFNGDGLDDVASLPAGDVSQNVFIYLQGDTGLLTPQMYPFNHTETFYNDMKVGDLNGDGLDDLVVVSSDSPADDNIAVLLQDPDGGFADQVLYDAPGSQTYDSVAIGDVNNDGLNDLVVGPRSDSFFQILTQTQEGTLEFFDSFDLRPNEDFDSLEIRDLDGDGLNEIFGVSKGILLVFSSPAHPQGVALQQEIDLMSDDSWDDPQHLAVQDLDGDGVLDIAVANPDLGVQILAGSGRIFSDDFESADTHRWSTSQN